ncbi:TspO protein, partial [miscellaneous Crenarchaeota group-15 archaeon DG-45]
APPNWVITPVWLMLFTLMGFSLYLILNKRSEDKGTRVALGIFGVQLVINTSWNYFFFGLRSLLSGLIVIIVMWVTIAITIAAFFRVSKKAGALLLPYLLWVSVAALINYYLWILNPA